MRISKRFLGAISALALVMVMGSCAVGFQAETVEQRWYAAKADYAVAVNAAADYCEQPTSDLGVCMRAVEVSRQANLVIAHGDTVFRGAVSQARNDRLLVLARELLDLAVELRGLKP